jgi:hypothetical protein
MGNGQSQEEIDKVGYRVLGVQPGSPAANGGLVSFFDFIVVANGIPLKTLDSTFIDLIKNSEDKPLPLQVYNCKNHSVREIILVPSRQWAGEGMLGVTIRFDTFLDAEEHLCRVLEVEADSPAELAGLIPGRDYLLGTAEKVFKDTDVLYDELAANVEIPVEFYVYNADTDEVRIVVVMPSDQWGKAGDQDCGLLGADVAHGFLHGLPSECCHTIGSSSVISTKSLCSPFGYNDQAVGDVAATYESKQHLPQPPPATAPGYAPPLPPHVQHQLQQQQQQQDQQRHHQ